MLDILLVVLFCWLFWKATGLAFRVAWGTTKILASILLTVALPLLAACLIFAGGLLLMVPIALIVFTFILLKACV